MAMLIRNPEQEHGMAFSHGSSGEYDEKRMD
jgi:hypothetical protein